MIVELGHGGEAAAAVLADVLLDLRLIILVQLDRLLLVHLDVSRQRLLGHERVLAQAALHDTLRDDYLLVIRLGHLQSI